MFEILGNIYGRSIAIVFGTALLVLFGDWKLIFLTEIFPSLIFMSFYPENSRIGSRKNSITQDWLVVESCPTLL